MSIKEYAKGMMRDFFVITTFVNIAMYLLGSAFQPDMMLSHDVLLRPPVYGLVGMLTIWVMYSKRELTVKQLIFRMVLQVILLEVMLILLTFGFEHLKIENLKMIVSFASSVLIIYVLVRVVSFLLDKKEAGDMMALLTKYQESNLK